MNLSIYLFRHGQTYHNRDAIFSGWSDTRLTKTGMENAKIVALRLKDKEINVAYQSRLTRSKETLKEVLKYHNECRKIITDNRIIERNYGILQGTSHYDFVKKNSSELYDKYHRAYDCKIPKGESMKKVEKRVLLFLKDLMIYMKKNKVNVAVSAHGNSMRPFRRYFEKWSVKHMMEMEMPYDGVFEYTVKV